MDRKFLGWFLVSMFYAYQYVLRVMPNVIASISIEKFKLSTIAFGQFSGLYYVGYTLAHIPLGILLDKYGPRAVLSVCAVLTFLGLVPLLVSDVWLFVQIGRVITGIGSAGSALGLFKVASMYYDTSKFGKMVGISIIVGLLGAMYGGLPVLSLLDKFGWETLFMIFIAVGAAVAVLLYVFILPYDSIANDRGNGTMLNNIKLVLCNKHVILISLFAGFMIGPLEGFADGWVTSFLREVGNMDKETSALLPSVIFIGVCLGAFVLPYMVDKSFNIFNILIVSAASMTLAFLGLFFNSSNVVLVTVLFVIIGFFSSYQIVATCHILRHVTDNVVALTSAVNNMIVMVFGYFFHTAISCIIDLNWDGTIIDSEPVYTKALMLKSMACIPAGLIIGLIGFLYLKYRDSK